MLPSRCLYPFRAPHSGLPQPQGGAPSQVVLHLRWWYIYFHLVEVKLFGQLTGWFFSQSCVQQTTLHETVLKAAILGMKGPQRHVIIVAL